MILFPYLFFYSVFCNCLVRFKKTFYNVKHAWKDFHPICVFLQSFSTSYKAVTSQIYDWSVAMTVLEQHLLWCWRQRYQIVLNMSNRCFKFVSSLSSDRLITKSINPFCSSWIVLHRQSEDLVCSESKPSMVKHLYFAHHWNRDFAVFPLHLSIFLSVYLYHFACKTLWITSVYDKVL